MSLAGLQSALQRVSCRQTLASPRSREALLRLVVPCAKGLAVVMDQTGCLMNQSGCGKSAADTGKPVSTSVARSAVSALRAMSLHALHTVQLACITRTFTFLRSAPLSCTTGASDIGQRLVICFLSLGYRSTTSSLPSTWTAACVSVCVGC